MFRGKQEDWPPGCCGPRHPVAPTLEAVPPGSGPSRRARSPADVPPHSPAQRGVALGDRKDTLMATLTFTDGLSGLDGGSPLPPCPGCMAADTQMLLHGLACNKEAASKTYLNGLWPAGCVRAKWQSDAGRIPSGFEHLPCIWAVKAPGKGKVFEIDSRVVLISDCETNTLKLPLHQVKF